MGLNTIRRLAASILKVGESRIRITDEKKALEALTRDDVRGLVKSGVVIALQKKGVGRTGSREKAAKKKAGRGRGPGKRKGTGSSDKVFWMRKVRSQRKYLQAIKQRLEKAAYRKIYRMVKGNAFKDVAGVKAYISKLVK